MKFLNEQKGKDICKLNTDKFTSSKFYLWGYCKTSILRITKLSSILICMKCLQFFAEKNHENLLLGTRIGVLVHGIYFLIDSYVLNLQSWNTTFL